jgi:cob(I)alamin adenosyltransferase
MSDQPFDEPRLAINRVYTRQGDAGETALAGGQRVPKDGARIQAYGSVDELNALLGAARVTAGELQLGKLSEVLLRMQHELFNLGSMLATLPQDLHPRQARITPADVERLEVEIDHVNHHLQPLRSFVLPGSSRLNAELHLCRTVCRRAERDCVTLARAEEAPAEAVRYLNRLSDALFVWSRWATYAAGAPETLWDPNRPAE